MDVKNKCRSSLDSEREKKAIIAKFNQFLSRIKSVEDILLKENIFSYCQV